MLKHSGRESIAVTATFTPSNGALTLPTRMLPARPSARPQRASRDRHGAGRLTAPAAAGMPSAPARVHQLRGHAGVAGHRVVGLQRPDGGQRRDRRLQRGARVVEVIAGGDAFPQVMTGRITRLELLGP